jgi:hypothetical protein
MVGDRIAAQAKCYLCFQGMDGLGPLKTSRRAHEAPAGCGANRTLGRLRPKRPML